MRQLVPRPGPPRWHYTGTTRTV